MKKIAIYEDGSVGYVDVDGKHTVVVNGQAPKELLEPTAENIQKYFGDIKLPDANVVIA